MLFLIGLASISQSNCMPLPLVAFFLVLFLFGTIYNVLYFKSESKYIDEVVNYKIHWIDNQPIINFNGDYCVLNHIIGGNISETTKSVSIRYNYLDPKVKYMGIYPLGETRRNKYSMLEWNLKN